MNMTSSSSSSSNNTDGGYIHKFGHQFAKQLLGPQVVDEFVQKFHHQQQQQQQQQQSQAVRANWRSDVRFPWQLLQPKYLSVQNGDCQHNNNGGTGGSSSESIIMAPETLFVDVTFDFLLFPLSAAASFSSVRKEGEENNTIVSYHVLKKGDWKSKHSKEEVTSVAWENNDVEETIPIAMAVSIRIGALLAIPDSQCCHDTISSSISPDSREKCDENDNTRNGKFQFYYQQGNPLATLDIHKHCRSVDVDPEFSDAADIANLMADSFLKGGGYNAKSDVVATDGIAMCKSDGVNDGTVCPSAWQVSAVLEDKVASSSNDNDDNINNNVAIATTNDVSGTTDHSDQLWKWDLKLRHESLELEGLLTFHHQECSNSTSNSARCQKVPGFKNAIYLGELIGQQTLDMMLLQSNPSNNECGYCIAIPKSEAWSLWKKLAPNLVEALEQQPAHCMSITASTTSLYRQSITRSSDNEQSPTKYHTDNSTKQIPGKFSPTKIIPQWDTNNATSTNDKYNQIQQHNVNKRSNQHMSQKPASYTRSQSQETAVFARGKKTSISGSKRKKKKFTLGDI